MGVIGDHRTRDHRTASDQKGKGEEHDEEEVVVKMRNYVPRGDGVASSMKTTILPNAKAPSSATLDDATRRLKNEDDDEEEKEDPSRPMAFDGGEAKKRNWDLKRDVARRMEKLDRETKRAVAELARDEEQQHE